ncbi:MAG: CBS domain-containing protein [Alphaproteobacteria bacterium]|nr:CBS domain-containing protein [Alphaproteobacteria bacterium]
MLAATVLVALSAAALMALAAADPRRLRLLALRGNLRAADVGRLLAEGRLPLRALRVVLRLSVGLVAGAAAALAYGHGGPGAAVAAAVAAAAAAGVAIDGAARDAAMARPERAALALHGVAALAEGTIGPLLRLVDRLRGQAAPGEGAGAPPDPDQAATLPAGADAAAARDARDELAMLRSVAELDEVTVGEIMVHRRNLDAIDADAAPRAIVERALRSPHTRLPVWRDNPENIVGVLHVKALARAVQESGDGLDDLDVLQLASAPWFVPDSTTLLDLLQAFRTRRERFALVVDEYGVLEGAVTLEDILEEIVGEIGDELDSGVPGVRPQPDGSCLVEGTVTIRDINRALDWGLPDDNAATIAGLVLHEARQIPAVGQVFSFFGFRFEVVRRQRNQLLLLRVLPPSGKRRRHVHAQRHGRAVPPASP